jgi:hypothetical protein
MFRYGSMARGRLDCGAGLHVVIEWVVWYLNPAVSETAATGLGGSYRTGLGFVGAAARM